MSTDSLNYPKSNINAYLELTKPSIIYLLVLTAATSMFLAGSFSTNLSQALTGILGIGMIAASSAAINQILDVSIDSKMKRTGNRPLVRNLISVKNASVFAFMLFAVGSFILLFFNNVLAWSLTTLTWIFYAFFYTKILKFTGTQNIVIGGLAGAMPPLLGWVAVMGSIDILPLLFVMIIFVWTPPHFWALAIDRKSDYEEAGIPMMPVVRGIEYTKIQIVLYSFLLLAVSWLPFATGYLGTFYLIVSSSLGAVFIYFAFALNFDKENKKAIPFFFYSIFYLTVLFITMPLDRILF